MCHPQMPSLIIASRLVTFLCSFHCQRSLCSFHCECASLTCVCLFVYFVVVFGFIMLQGEGRKKEKNSKIARKAKGIPSSGTLLDEACQRQHRRCLEVGISSFFGLWCCCCVVVVELCCFFCCLSINLHVVGHLSVQLIGSLGRLLLSLTSTATTTTTGAVTATGSSLSTLRLSLVVVVVASGSWCPGRERSGNVTRLERDRHYGHSK